MIETTVGTVMSDDVGTVAPDVPATEAAARLLERDIGSLVVVEDGDIVGILTESDLVALVRDGAPASTPIREYMSAPVVAVTSDTSVEAAADRLREHNIKKLPVVDGESLVGIVTTTDLALYLPNYRVEPE